MALNAATTTTREIILEKCKNAFLFEASIGYKMHSGKAPVNLEDDGQTSIRPQY